MSQPLKITCLKCATPNRVPSDKLGAGPKCGTCGAPLMDGKVHDLDPTTFAKAAKTDDVPLIVDFWAPWCAPCRMMAPEFQKAAANMGAGARFAKINTEQFPKVSEKNGIRGIPTMIVYQRGKEVARQSGAVQARAIETFVKAKSRVGG